MRSRTWKLIAIALAVLAAMLLIVVIGDAIVGADAPAPATLVSEIVAVIAAAAAADATDPTDPCSGDWPTTVVSFDYFTVGGGPGGSATTYDITSAIKASPVSSINSQTIGLIEARDRIGGNFWDVDLVKPAGYAVGSPPLRIGMGGLRVNMLTLLNERRMFSELGVPLLFTPFRQHQFTRGRNNLCAVPAPDQTFTNFCSNANTFINESNVGASPIGSAFIGLGATLPYGDPSYDGWCFLTNSVEYPAADAGCVPIPPHPLTGLTCNDSSSDQRRWCPQKACKQYVDFKSFIAGYLSPEYAYFMEMDNVGFRGDYQRSFDACAYLDWQTREWNTASNNGMPVGGMSQLPLRAVARAKALGAKVYTSQPAMCVRRKPAASTGTHLYEVRTPGYTFNVGKWLNLAIPNIDVHRVGKIGGDIINELRAKKETTFARNASVATISMQWNPDTPAWFYDYLDVINGNYSLRQYGDEGCFSRLEIWDTPYHRYHNGIRVVYSDAHCKELWDDLIRRGEARYAAGLTLLVAYNETIARVMQELHASFPGATIPAPVWVRGASWEHAWYFGEPLRNMTNAQVTQFALAPLGASEKLCLIGDAWNGKYSGHAESALISSRKCLTQSRFASGTLASRLAKIYSDRDAIIANNFNALTACPSGLPNEYCGPYGPYNTDGTLHHDYCVGNSGQAAGYTCVPYGTIV